jgi:acyl CoA:acetate/3-ketoacid CoA transferase beta subunit
VLDVTAAGLVLTEMADGETVEGIREVTGATFAVADNLRSMNA